MKKLFGMFLALFVVAISCDNNEADGYGLETGELLVFEADYSALLSGDMTPGDEVGIYNSTSPIFYEVARIEDGSAILKSNIKMNRASGYSAVYPYMTDALMNNGKLTLTLPQNQEPQAYPASHIAVAKTTTDMFVFRNVTALVKLTLNIDGVTKITFKGNSGEQVAGKICVDMENASWASAGDDGRLITIAASEGALAKATYCVSVLPQKFESGYTVTCYKEDTHMDIMNDQAFTLTTETLVSGTLSEDGENWEETPVEPENPGDGPDTPGTEPENPNENPENPGGDNTSAGSGTQSDPYIIKTADDLISIGSKLSVTSVNYIKLAADINMVGISTWAPICSSTENVPEIHFDGGNHTISNFAPTNVTSLPSLFGVLYGSCKNLKMTGVNLSFTKNGVAPVCVEGGVASGNNTTFENVHVSGTVSGGTDVGGFVAISRKASYTNCSADVKVSATAQRTGGFVGSCRSGDNTFIACGAKGNVSNIAEKRFVGGFMGGYDGYTGKTLKFEKCYATGDVVADYQSSAFIGYLDNVTTTITNCYATGDVTAPSGVKQGKHIGGIVGVNKGNLTVTNCFYSGALASGKNEAAGGILGLAANITDGQTCKVAIVGCISTGSVTATAKAAGGILGYSKGTSLEIEKCYSDCDVQAEDYIGGIAGWVATGGTIKDSGFGGSLKDPGKDGRRGTILACSLSGSETAVYKFTITGCWRLSDFSNDPDVSDQDGGTDATCRHNGTKKPDNSTLYATPSKAATQLGWSTGVWDLTADNPKLK